jgi:carboxyl-terminal processing protease
MPFHGKVAVLVDGSTTGAGERIAAFAQERKLAPVVGARTAGRLICCSVYRVGHGYFIRVPARAWYTWSGELLEEKGVVPDYAVNAHRDEADVLLERAVEVVRGL